MLCHKNSRKYCYLVFAVICLFVFSALYVSTQNNIVVRAAIDIGSGSTKIRVVEFNKKTNKVEKILYSDFVSVPYQNSLEMSNGRTFDEATMSKGLGAIEKFRKATKSLQVEKIIGIATAAFRQARNAPEFTEEIFRKTGVKVFIIDQDMEGKLAFYAASAKLNDRERKRLVVWDIGGGSCQITTLDQQGDFMIYKGHVAAIPFRNYIIEQVQGRSLKEHTSPNPLSLSDVEKATEYARSLGGEVGAEIRRKLASPGVTVIGVGNAFGIRKQTVYSILGNKDYFSRGELEKAVLSSEGLTDEDMGGGDYADISITNPILVLGMMEALRINSMYIRDIDNTNGAFLIPRFWK